jgi:acyl-CoA synthetase (AMP-forming)/AMP-acid ligase II
MHYAIEAGDAISGATAIRASAAGAFAIRGSIDMSSPKNLWEILHAAPGDRTAMIIPESGARISYGRLREQVGAMAGALKAAGIGRGDRVAIVLPNGLPAIVAFFAASIAGTAAPLNPAYRRDEFSFYLEDTSARILLCPPDGAAEAREAAEGRMPVLEVATDGNGFPRIGAQSAATAKPELPGDDDIALVLHTSGSTGRPKRVPLRHRNLAASAANIVNCYALSPEDVTLCVMPLFHIHGLMASTVATILSGGAIVVPAKFSPFSFWRMVRDYRVTWFTAVPTIHHLLLSRAGGERPPGSESLRFIRSCSASLPADMMRKMEHAFAAPVLEAYGMTEAAHQMCSNPQPPAARKPGSVGPGTGVRVSIVDAAGNHLATNVRGEVVIQGLNVFSGYENNPEANASSFTNGWFRTGDQGFLDADGYLTLTGRIKELINRGGEKIAPREIDEVLLTHPAVAEAVAFGAPHPIWGEEVAAAVVLREPADEAAILGFCRERMADFKCPKRVYFVETIPRTASGKIQRGAVAQALLAENQ